MAGASGLDVQVGGAFGRVGDQPVGVVIGGGVAVVGVQVEVHAGVAEVVLQPPPRTHPVDDLRRAHVGELLGGQVGDGALAPGQRIEPGRGHVCEQGRGPPAAVGDDRRVLVGFDRGGWSPALFAHMAPAGFDPLPWRKGTIPDLPAEQFTDVAYTGETGRENTWHLADPVVEVPIDDHGGVFPMRQVTRWDTKKNTLRQVHVLTTRTDLSAAQVIYRMGARWRLENYFRYARMHFDLDSHHCYASTDDDPQRLVPNPAKRAAHLDVQVGGALGRVGDQPLGVVVGGGVAVVGVQVEVLSLIHIS